MSKFTKLALTAGAVGVLGAAGSFGTFASFTSGGTGAATISTGDVTIDADFSQLNTALLQDLGTNDPGESIDVGSVTVTNSGSKDAKFNRFDMEGDYETNTNDAAAEALADNLEIRAGSGGQWTPWVTLRQMNDGVQHPNVQTLIKSQTIPAGATATINFEARLPESNNDTVSDPDNTFENATIVESFDVIATEAANANPQP